MCMDGIIDRTIPHALQVLLVKPSADGAAARNDRKFAVDSSFQPVSCGQCSAGASLPCPLQESLELGEWREEGKSWEAEANVLQEELVEQSRESLREKRAEERERRRVEQELVRMQKQQAAHSTALGTRLH